MWAVRLLSPTALFEPAWTDFQLYCIVVAMPRVPFVSPVGTSSSNLLREQTGAVFVICIHPRSDRLRDKFILTKLAAVHFAMPLRQGTLILHRSYNPSNAAIQSHENA